MTHIQAIDQETERKNRTISGFSTTGFFILLALLLWLVKFEKPTKEELPEEYEIPVTLDDGPSGGGQGAPADDVPMEAAPNVPKMSIPSATEQTNDATAVPVKKSSTIPNPVNKIDEDQQLLNDMLNKKKNSTVSGKGGTGNDPFGTGNGTGEGNGDGPGSGPGPGGTGTGGPTHNLSGRRLLNVKKIVNDCNTQGTVKYNVVVQPDGSISSIETDPGYDDNTCLVNKGKAILRNANFDKTNANKIVTGQITINFKLQ
ncbi:MAG: hypothetical protein IT245_08685 [Bacteroidia bacterium]|nr:hypothetical protein [Bacteroidia bacterium]